MANTLSNIGRGLARGITADVLGMPVDTLNMLREGLLSPAAGGNPSARVLGGLLGPVQQTGSGDWFAQQMGLPQGEGMAYEAARMVSPSPSDVMGLVRRAPIQEIMTYHGTPHRFEPTPENPLGEFRASQIGTGEGNQMYGHGIYLAENPKVAQDYQYGLSKIDPYTVTYQGKSAQEWYDAAAREQDRAHRLKNNDAISKANAKLAYWESVMTRNHPADIVRRANDPDEGWPEFAQYANSLDMKKFNGLSESGSLYTSDLPDEMVDRMLDWNKPLSEQPDNVKKALEPLVREALKKQGTPEGYLDYHTQRKRGGDIRELLRSNIGDRAFAEKMKGLGIPGIKYLDAGSRGDKAKPTRNFVVFPGEEKKVKILKRE